MKIKFSRNLFRKDTFAGGLTLNLHNRCLQIFPIWDPILVLPEFSLLYG